MDLGFLSDHFRPGEHILTSLVTATEQCFDSNSGNIRFMDQRSGHLPERPPHDLPVCDLRDPLSRIRRKSRRPKQRPFLDMVNDCVFDHGPEIVPIVLDTLRRQVHYAWHAVPEQIGNWIHLPTGLFFTIEERPNQEDGIDIVQRWYESGRLFFHMLAAIAEFEHDLIVERTRDGLAAARARGRKGGPKFKMTPTKVKQARAMYDAGEHTVQQIAETFGVSRPTIYRHLEQDTK